MGMLTVTVPALALNKTLILLDSGFNIDTIHFILIMGARMKENKIDKKK